MIEVNNEEDWQALVRILKATKVEMNQAKQTEGPIWIETLNFGFLLSAKDLNGHRHFIAKF